METFWGLVGFGLCIFLLCAGIALILYADNKEKTSSQEEVSDDSV